jgi:hypothetical protein
MTSEISLWVRRETSAVKNRTPMQVLPDWDQGASLKRLGVGIRRCTEQLKTIASILCPFIPVMQHVDRGLFKYIFDGASRTAVAAPAELLITVRINAILAAPSATR